MAPLLSAFILLTLLGAARSAPAETIQDSLGYATVAPYAAANKEFFVDRLGGAIVLPASALTPAGFRLPRWEAWGPRDSTGGGLIPWNDVKCVKIRASSWPAGAVVGGVLGLLGGAIVVGISNGVADGLGGEVDDEQAYTGMAIAIVGGVAVGALIAAPRSHWRTIYARPGVAR